MPIALAPDETTTPLDPKAAKPPLGLAPNVTAAGTSPTAPLPTEYPSAPSTAGTPQNRLQLATTAFDTFAKSTAPQYTADLRQATQQAAGNGQVGSGMLRTTYGNLANQRALALDTERSNLINTATSATIADQQAERGLGIQQQNADTSRLGTTGGLSIQQQAADTARLGTVGNLDVAKGTLGLETQKAATAADQGQQSIDIAKQTAVIDAQYKAGTLTLAQRNQQLAELQNTQQYGLAQSAQTQQANQFTQSLGLEQQKLALATAAQDVATKVSLGQLSIAQAQQALDEKVKTGELTVEQAKLALDQINSAAQNKVSQQNADTNTGQLQLAKDSLAQTGAQFGLSLAQQKDLATLADKTANRQLDISAKGEADQAAQGSNSLLVEIARILGTSTNKIDPDFLKEISKALGIGIPKQEGPPDPNAPPGTDVGDPYRIGGTGSPYGS